MTKPKKATTIIIEGITEDGEVFRPSDWAHRLCGSLSTFENQRIHYSPLLKPSYYNGQPCVVVDLELKELNFELFHYVLDFALTNKLKIISGNYRENQ